MKKPHSTSSGSFALEPSAGDFTGRTADTDLQTDLELLENAAAEAGQIALRYFSGRGKKFAGKIETKGGNSPVTEADFAVDHFLKETLLSARPDYGWLSEESIDDHTRLKCKRIFVVDPIDGTRGFIAGSPQWCISVAIVEDDRPIIGLLEVPALSERFLAVRGGGAYLNGEALRLENDEKSEAIRSISASRKLNEVMASNREIKKANITVTPFIPSLAYRLAMVASGKIDAAIARPGAHEWDLAAADIILTEAGGRLVDLEDHVPLYNQVKPGQSSLIASSLPRQKTLQRLAQTSGFLH